MGTLDPILRRVLRHGPINKYNASAELHDFHSGFPAPSKDRGSEWRFEIDFFFSHPPR